MMVNRSSGFLVWLLLPALFFLHLVQGQETALPVALKDFDPQRLLRFDDLATAAKRRDELNRFIWPLGLPGAAPVVSEVTDPPELQALNKELIQRTERLEISVGDFDFQALAFRLYPRQPARPSTTVIVHHGHVPDGPENYLMAGVDDTIEHLLLRGCIVVIMQMPLVGWNQDRTGILSDGTPFEIQARGTSGHNQLFEQLAHTLNGQAFRFFLEPVLQAVNLASKDSARIGMIGLSGGGWTTHMAAAIDTRIQFSVPVAGAMPLYAREFSRGSRGDAEQQYDPLFREIDGNADGIAETADGVASWLEVFALGGIGSADRPRTQVQVLNFYDSCCFSGDVYVTYADFLSRKVAAVEGGTWSVFSDTTHRDHVISAETLTKVLDPLLAP